MAEAPRDRRAYSKQYYQKHRESRIAYAKEYRQRNLKEVQAKDRARHFINKYGITPEQYEVMLLVQGGTCAVCGDVPGHYHVDHCHDTGKVRGLLCRMCNLGIGHLGDDSELLQAGADYLRSA